MSLSHRISDRVLPGWLFKVEQPSNITTALSQHFSQSHPYYNETETKKQATKTLRQAPNDPIRTSAAVLDDNTAGTEGVGVLDGKRDVLFLVLLPVPLGYAGESVTDRQVVLAVDETLYSGELVVLLLPAEIEVLVLGYVKRNGKTCWKAAEEASVPTA